MPKKRKKGKDIVVDTNYFRSEKEPFLKDTTGVEALDVFKVSGKIGRPLSGLMIIVGALLSLFSLFGILTSIQFIFSNLLFVGALGFLGAVNIFCGLMLLTKK